MEDKVVTPSVGISSNLNQVDFTAKWGIYLHLTTAAPLRSNIHVRWHPSRSRWSQMSFTGTLVSMWKRYIHSHRPWIHMKFLILLQQQQIKTNLVLLEEHVLFIRIVPFGVSCLKSSNSLQILHISLKVQSAIRFVCQRQNSHNSVQ